MLAAPLNACWWDAVGDWRWGTSPDPLRLPIFINWGNWSYWEEFSGCRALGPPRPSTAVGGYWGAVETPARAPVNRGPPRAHSLRQSPAPGVRGSRCPSLRWLKPTRSVGKKRPPQPLRVPPGPTPPGGFGSFWGDFGVGEEAQGGQLLRREWEPGPRHAQGRPIYSQKCLVECQHVCVSPPGAPAAWVTWDSPGAASIRTQLRPGVG